MASDALTLSEWKAEGGSLSFEQSWKWYKGEYCNRFPLNRETTVDDILLGWMPETPFITKSTKALALGSCFADYFIQFLKYRGYNDWLIREEKFALIAESIF